MSQPTRPVLRYHGGKWRLAPWIISHFPAHRVYTEAFGGAASVLLRKPRVPVEVYNDLSDDVVNLFRILRNDRLTGQLIEALGLTPFARREYEAVRKRRGGAIERARRLVARSEMGFGSDAATRSDHAGFRFGCTKGSFPARQWPPTHFQSLTSRLRGVLIESDHAPTVLGRYDAGDALHYVDPPYPLDTRATLGDHGEYAHEMTQDDHRELAATLRTLEGFVILSGYPCDLYDRELYPDWHRVTRTAMADGAKKRTEVLWLNPKAADALTPELDLGA